MMGEETHREEDIQVEIGLMETRARECQRPPEAGRRREILS